MIGVVALVGMVIWAARPPDSGIAGAIGDAIGGAGEVCNGHAELVEDHVEAADIAESVIDAGLEDYLYTPVEGDPFRTLGEMIRSGQRLVVMVEAGDGRPDFPWLVNGFDFVQETPYDFPTVESFSCEPNRGVPDAPLLQINHWLNGFDNLVTDAQLVNAADVLGPRVEQCRDERAMQPNLVAVNSAGIGDLLGVVDELNGVD